ncbi:MAG: hypothetical protein Q8R83_04310 [Legionellaceae bacterium]|nr:hypothetical protein [Legionellaceae bacterium]
MKAKEYYQKDMSAITAKYYLNKEQQKAGNLDREKLTSDKQSKINALKDIDHNLETFKNTYQSNGAINKLSKILKKFDDAQSSKKQKYLDLLENSVENEEPAKTYRDLVIKHMNLSLELDQINLLLKNCNYAMIQTTRYQTIITQLRMSVGELDRLADTMKLKADRHDNYLTKKWNQWIDAHGFNKTYKFYNDQRVALYRLIAALEQKGNAVTDNKTLQELENELFIMQTLAKACDNITVLATDYRCCIVLATKVPSEDISLISLGEFNSGYVRVLNVEKNLNSLFYINKREQVCVEISKDYLTQFDSKLKPTSTPHCLSEKDLQQVKAATGHDPVDKCHIDLQISMAHDLREVHRRCNQLKHSGNPYLRYAGDIFMLLAAIIVVVAAVSFGMYLGGGVAAGIIVAALTALHASPVLAMLATTVGCGLAGGACVAASGITGLLGFGLWRAGGDKNVISRDAREVADNLVTTLVQNPHG